MMAMSDPEDDMNNYESDTSSTNRNTTPCPSSSNHHSKSSILTIKSPIVTHNININYHHNHSIINKNGDSLDINALATNFIQHTSIPVAGEIIKKEEDEMKRP